MKLYELEIGNNEAGDILLIQPVPSQHESDTIVLSRIQVPIVIELLKKYLEETS